MVFYSPQIRNYIREFGFSLVIVGVPIGMYMNFFIADIRWSNIIMLIGATMIASLKNISSFRFPNISKHLSWILCFHFTCLIYIIFYTGTHDNSKLTIFHFFLIGLTLAVSSISPKETISLQRIINITWIISFICSMLAFYCIINGYYKDYYEMTSGRLSNATTILEAFTMSSACVTNIVASLYLNTGKKTIDKYIITISIFIDIYLIALLEKRTPMIISALVILFFIVKKRVYVSQFLRNNLFTLGGIFIVVAILLAYYIDLTLFIDKLDDFWFRFTNGISDMQNGTMTSGRSAVARYYARQRALDFIWNDMSWYNYLLGSGYYSIGQLDLPVIQIFIEMGLYGIYTVLSFMMIPIVVFVKSRNKYIQYACLGCFYMIFCSFNSGNPYNFTRWICVIFLMFVISYCRKAERRNN